MFAAHNLLLTPPPTSAASVAIINASSAQATSVTIPTHQIGDTIIIYAWRSSTTLPSKPTASGTVPAWNDIDATAGANSCSSRTAYFTAVATNTTSGTWANAKNMVAVVLRGAAGSPIGGHAESGGTTSTTSPYPAIAPAITMTNTDGTSALLHFYGAGTVSTWSAAPAGFTTLTSVGSGGATSGACCNNKNVTTSDGSSSEGTGWSASTGYRGAAVEIVSH